MSRLARWASIFAVTIASSVAGANENGKISRSGKQGETCSECHTGGNAPTVTITGPDALAAGASGAYTFTITGGGAVVGGLNVAVSTGASLSNPGAGAKLSGSEITHSTPKSFSGGSASWTFDVTAPASGAAFTIFGAGNSADGDGNDDSGDSIETTTKMVAITGGGATDGGAIDASTPAQPPATGCAAAPGAASVSLAWLALLLAVSAHAARRRA